MYLDLCRVIFKLCIMVNHPFTSPFGRISLELFPSASFPVANPSVWRLLVCEKLGGFPSPSIVMASPPTRPPNKPREEIRVVFCRPKIQGNAHGSYKAGYFWWGKYVFQASYFSANRRNPSWWQLKDFLECLPWSLAGWWFPTFFIFTPTWGNDPIWRAYFSNGLNPPTSWGFMIQFLWLSICRFIGQDKKQLTTCDVKLRALGTGGVAEGRGPCDDGCPKGSGVEKLGRSWAPNHSRN